MPDGSTSYFVIAPKLDFQNFFGGWNLDPVQANVTAAKFSFDHFLVKFWPSLSKVNDAAHVLQLSLSLSSLELGARRGRFMTRPLFGRLLLFVFDNELFQSWNDL